MISYEPTPEQLGADSPGVAVGGEGVSAETRTARIGGKTVEYRVRPTLLTATGTAVAPTLARRCTTTRGEHPCVRLTNHTGPHQWGQHHEKGPTL